MTNTFVAQLMSYLSTNFPNFQFPPVEYECYLLSGTAGVTGKMNYLAKFKLLGQNICAQGRFETPETALEASSKAALTMAEEFVRLLKSDTSKLTEAEHEDLSIILKALNQEAQGSSSIGKVVVDAFSAMNAHLLSGQNEKIQVAAKERNEALAVKFDSTGTNGEDKSRMERLKSRLMAEIQEVKSVSQSNAVEPIELVKPTERLEPAKLSPLRDPRLSASGTQQSQSAQQTLGQQSMPPSQVSQPLPSLSANATILPDPITTIHEYADKSGLKKPVLFEDYRRYQFFGCRLEWNGRFWVSPADFRSKKEAHMRAALMACVELFGGEGYRYEGIDSSTYRSWTRTSIRAECDKYVFASSADLLQRGGSSSRQSREKVDSQDDSSSDTNSTTATASSAVPTAPIEPLPNGRKYLSELNEICQKLNWPLPVFSYASVNAVNNYFVCCVRGFYDFPLMESAPFTKKNAAKEDVSGRIFLKLKERGFIEEARRNYQEKRRALDSKANESSSSAARRANGPSQMNQSPLQAARPNSQMNQAPMQASGPNSQFAHHPMQTSPPFVNTNSPMALMQMMSMMPLLSTLMTQATQNPNNQELQVQVGTMWQQMMMLCQQGASAGTGSMGNAMGNGMSGMNGISGISGMMYPTPQMPMPMQLPQMVPMNQTAHVQQPIPSMPSSMPPPRSASSESSHVNPSRRYDSYRPQDERRYYHVEDQPGSTDYDRSFEEGEIRRARNHKRERGREYRR